MFDILRQKHINKLKSVYLSIKCKSLFCAAHKSKIILNKNAKINIKDGLFFILAGTASKIKAAHSQ